MKLFFCIFLFINISYANDAFIKMANKQALSFNAPIITIEKLQKLNNVVFLDARELEEYNVSHIKDAIHVGYDSFNLENVTKKLLKDQQIIVYCSVGYRSGDIAARLIKKSYNAKNLYGGIFLWSNLELPLYDKGNKPTKKVHGYNKSWSKWLTKGEVVLPPSFFMKLLD